MMGIPEPRKALQCDLCHSPLFLSAPSPGSIVDGNRTGIADPGYSFRGVI
jgi:hypothetical protein